MPIVMPPGSDLLVPREVLKEVSRDLEWKLESGAAKDTCIPIIYGRDRIGGRIFTAQHYGDSLSASELTLGVAWCLGEAESIDKIFVNDVSVNDPSLQYLLYSESFLGTSTQTAPYSLASIIDGYDDDLVFTMEDGTKIGVCYTVIYIPYNSTAAFPNVEAIIKGRKVYDPREVTHDPDDSSTWEWSDNPALHLADFIVSPHYGAGLDIVWNDVSVIADRNDKIIDVDSSTVLRSNNVTLDKLTKTESWVEALRSYAACFMYETSDGVRLVADAPASIEASIIQDNIVEDSLKMEIAGERDNPTVVKVKYTDITDGEWTSRQAVVQADGVSTGATPRIESLVEMPGINSYQQALREALLRFKHFYFEDLTAKAVLFDEGIRYHKGMVVHVSHPYGLSQNMRIQSVDRKDTGRWNVYFKEYQESTYTSAIEDNPITPDTNLPSPYDVPAISGLAAEEEIYQLANGEWSARIRIEWDDPPSAYAYPIEYVTLLIDAETGKTAWQNNGSLREIVTPPLKDLPNITPDLSQTYNIRCYARSSIGIKGAEQQIEITTVGKTALPSDVPSISGYVLQGVVYLYWAAAYDLDIRQYHIKYGATKDWDAMQGLDKPFTLHSNYANIPEGNWWFGVKAQDTLGQFSENAAFVYLEVDNTGNPRVVAAQAFEASALDGVFVHKFRSDRVSNKDYIITVPQKGDGGKGSMASAFPNVLNTYGSPLCNYHSTAYSRWYSDTVTFDEAVIAKYKANTEKDYYIGDSFASSALYVSPTSSGARELKPVDYAGEVKLTQLYVATSVGKSMYFSPSDVFLSGVFNPTQEAGSRETLWAKRALVCGADESWVVAPDASAVNIQSGGYSAKTMQAIFRTGVSVTSRQFIVAQGSTNKGMSIYISGGKILSDVINSAGAYLIVTAPSSILPENQYHVAARFQSSTLSLSINGVSVNTAKGGNMGTLNAHPTNISLGVRINDSGTPFSHFTGKIFQVSQNNAVLTDTEISAAVHGGYTGWVGPLAQMYYLNDYSGGTAARDRSSYANHGSIATASAIDCSLINQGRCVITQHPFYYRESITLTPEGVDPRYFTHSGLVLGGDHAGFCIHGFDHQGSTIDASVHWEFRGA